MKHSLLSILLLLSACLAQAQSYVPEKSDARFAIGSAIPMKAYAFDLRNVRLLQGSPFWNAMRRDSAYLLEIEPDRLLHRFHVNAGLQPKGEVYGGWESEGLSGHTLGHYLSACSMMYAATGEVEFRRRVEYITAELARCQAARKSGYVGAIPNEDTVFARVARGEIHSSGFDLNGAWSPWYTVHKVMAGLIDAYLYCGNEQALRVAVGLANWTGTIVNPLTDAQRRKMLECEYGGMNDVLANIYAITGDRKYLDLSYKFHDSIMDSVALHVDPMSGRHANTNIPKAIGAAREYELSGLQHDGTIADLFWRNMVYRHAYVIGGVGNYEYCGAPGKLNDRLSDNTCETCCTYNLLKLTQHLFCRQPLRETMDYYERALYNDILASQNPTDGMMCYFLPLRMGAKKEFSDKFNTFTCCVGTGMENHAKYATAIYAESADNNLYVNLFIPSELDWKERGIVVRQETTFPSGDTSELTFSLESPATFALLVREPAWALGMRMEVNGSQQNAVRTKEGYRVITRTWNNGDKVRVVFRMGVRAESMPDNPDRVAFLYGPIVLAAQLGSSMPDPVYGTPVIVTGAHWGGEIVKKVPGEPLTFAIKGVARPADLILKPLYDTFSQYYSVYFDRFTERMWAARQQEYEEVREREHDLELRTIDDFRIGEMQPERDHKLTAGEQVYVDEAMGRKGREARRGNSFSFVMNVDTAGSDSLLFTYIGDDKNRKFDILVDGDTLTTVVWNGSVTGRFVDVAYPLLAARLTDKNPITVTIAADRGTSAARIFRVRTIRTGKADRN